MIIRCIQIFFFLFMYANVYGMHHEHRARVNAMREEKLIENWDLITLPPSFAPSYAESYEGHGKAEFILSHVEGKGKRTKIQPLDLKFDPAIINAHHTMAARKKGDWDCVRSRYHKAVPHMTYHSGVLKPTTEKEHTIIKKSMQQLAKNGDDEAQIKLTNHLLGGCFPSLDCLKANKAETNITLDLLAFLHPLAQEKKIIELEDIKHTIDNLKCNDENRIPQPISPAVAYILYTCNYLQSIENRDKNYNLFLLNQRNCFQTPEIETICQFLINYGDSKLSAEDAAKKFTHTIIELTKSQHDLLSEIARMPICSQVITQLNKVHFPENDVSFIDIHYVLAELYYNKKDYKNADKHYDQLYTQCSLSTKNNFTQLKSHAFIAYVITTENFDIKKDTEKINFFANVTFMEYFLRQKKINPQLSYKIGLFTQEAFKIYPYIKKDRLLRDVLGHLTYAQSYESWNQKELIILTNMQTSLHISLSDNQTYKQNYDLALNHLQQGLTHHAAYSNNPQDSEILKLLEHTAQKNPKFYTQYAQWITTILHLIYYPDKQKNPLFQTYPPSGFISSDFCLQLLPYLECAYKKTKPINMKLVT